MGRQSFTATARYFDRRASKASAAARRTQLQSAANYYRSRAEACGDTEPRQHQDGRSGPIPPRRRRLMELFRTYGADPDLP